MTSEQESVETEFESHARVTLVVGKLNVGHLKSAESILPISIWGYSKIKFNGDLNNGNI